MNGANMPTDFEARRSSASRAADDETEAHALEIISVLYNRVVTGAAPSLRKRLGLSLTEAKIVFFAERSGPITANQLARHFGLDKAAISRATHQLIKLGLIVAERDSEHAARNLLSLTDAGREAREAIAHFTFAREKHLLSGLNEREKRQFLESLNKVMARVDSTNALVDEGKFWP